MTKNINNNEIETIEGTYVETIENDNQYNEEPKKEKRNFLKPLIIGALAVVVTSGVGAYAYDKYETAQRTKIQDAYSNIKMNVGNQTNQNNNKGNNNNNNNGDNGSNSNSQNTDQSSNVQNNNNNSTQQNVQNAKSQQEIRTIVAQAISTPEQNINFVKVMPEYEDDYAYQNNGVPLYVYDVEARANGLEYDVVVDDVSGKVLKVEIDN